MKTIKTAIFIFLLTALACMAMNYGLMPYRITVVDEFDQARTDVTSVTIYDPGTTDAATLYEDRSKNNSLTNPVVDTNDLADGTISFWGQYASYDLVVTDGTYTVSPTGIQGSDNRVGFPTYISALSSYLGDSLANGWWPINNGFRFEGATADAYETSITMTDPTADNAVVFADTAGTVMVSALATNGQDAANSIWGISGGIRAEGATADTNETSITFTDPTADRSVVFADAAGTVMLSSLATNGPDVANSLWGASNGLVMEGATANDYELTITPEDPTADNTMTVADDSGYIMYVPDGNVAVAADELVIPVTHGLIQKTTGGDAEACTLANGKPGQILTVALVVDGGGDATITPATALSFTNVVMADANDIATFYYNNDTVGWTIMSGGNAAPPVTN